MRSTGSHPPSAQPLPIHELDAAIQAPRFLVAARLRRTLFAIAHGRELLGSSALQHQHTAHGLRAALAETDVVLAAAALVGMPFEPKLHVRVLRELLAVSLKLRVELGQDVGRVVVEVHDELTKQTQSLGLERSDADVA